MADWYDEKDFIDLEENSSVREYDITSTPNDFNIQTLYSLIDNGVIIMPPFQRNYVWDQRRASRLIESIILGLPIPQVFLYEKGKNNFYVIDGQQRLLSIYFFIKQRFPTKEGRAALRAYFTGDTKIDQSVLSDDRYFTNFSLSLPAPVAREVNKLNRLKYETLGQYKYTFEIMRTVRSVVIKQNEPDDDSSIYEIFNRLNTGGQNLSAQEIRMSMYYSEFYRAVINWNNQSAWRSLLRQKTPDIHFKDVEILLRSFAMLFHHETYTPSITKFLNAFSKEAAQFPPDMISYLGRLLESFFRSITDISAEEFLSKSGQFWVSLFESVFVAVCAPVFARRELVQGKVRADDVRALKRDADFTAATLRDIASKSNVSTRINRAKAIIRVY